MGMTAKKAGSSVRLMTDSTTQPAAMDSVLRLRSRYITAMVSTPIPA